MLVIELKQTEAFAKWESRLRDKRVRTIIATRLAHGLLVDVEPRGRRRQRAAYPHGPGYRVYFQKRGDILIVLLCGGDKKNTDPRYRHRKETGGRMEYTR